MKQVEDPLGQVFALASDCDATQLRLTAAEGYLLSRIDGSTPWRLLREMAGIPVDEADACLNRWIDEGVLDIVRDVCKSGTAATSELNGAATEAAVDAAEAPVDPVPVLQIDESQIDDGLDLEIAVQRRILEFEASLGRPYHELLDVAIGSEPKVVKRAYFKLSKEFHPDRYFRKDIGTYEDRLTRIFKKVLEAHEMLSDPELCQVRNDQEPVEEEKPEASVAASVVPAPLEKDDPVAETPKVLTKLERLKQRMPFKIDPARMIARRDQAREIFKAAELSLNAGRLAEAEASIRIAISFNPGCAEFKEALGSIRLKAAGAHATKLLATPTERMSEEDLREALTLLEDVLMYRPHDPKLNDRAAEVCLRLGKLDLAKGYVETLLEGTSDVAAYHTLAGRIYRELGETDVALSAFETALKLDADETDARMAVAALQLGARNVARGGNS